MIALMRISGGVGLAANQAGLDLSLIVIEYQDQIFRLVNPRIIRKEGWISFIEGCLSFPGLEVEVRRSEKVWVRALDEKGVSVVLEADGFLAVVFQHEIDHINGIPFIDRISFWQKLKIAPKLKLIIRRTKNGLRKQEKKS
jgi:peptide deformylase